MTVILPLAGFGTRLRPMTWSIPKPLLQCAGKTVLDWIFNSLSLLTVDKIVMIVGYKGDVIKEWVEEEYPGIPFEWVYQEEMEGLGHALWSAGKKADIKGETLIYLGDTVFDMDWSRISSADKNLVAVKEVENPKRFGVVEVENNKIINLIEKPESPPSNLAVVGLYFIKKWKSLYKNLNFIIKEDMRTKGEYQLTDALQRMISDKKISMETLPAKGWYDCGTVDTLLETNRKFLEYFYSDDEEGYSEEEKSFIGKNTEVENSSIGPHVSVGSDCFIGNSSVKNSIIGNGVKLENATIEDSIIGNRVRVEGYAGSVYLGSDAFISGKEEM